MSFKDQFSEQASMYAKFRPDYPESLFHFLRDLVTENHIVLDCGTGNGQTAASLANYFSIVLACDPSRKQLSQSRKRPNIYYIQSTAEHIGLQKNSVNLITVSQAIHWMKFDLFYQEAKRLLTSKKVISIWGYNLPQINPKIDEILSSFYTKILGDYWHKERKQIDEEYKSIPFPFYDCKTLEFQMKTEWSSDQYLGYIGTWSAVQNYYHLNGKNPLELVQEPIAKAWGAEKNLEITWPLFMKTGRVK